MKRDLTITLRDACIARGINPDDTGYKVPSRRFTALDRIIPGVADSKRIEYTTERRNPRRQYTPQSAANDRAQIAEGGTEAYVAAFCRLNNLTMGA